MDGNAYVSTCTLLIVAQFYPKLELLDKFHLNSVISNFIKVCSGLPCVQGRQTNKVILISALTPTHKHTHRD
jgi:hypothetical protein